MVWNRWINVRWGFIGGKSGGICSFEDLAPNGEVRAEVIGHHQVWHIKDTRR